MNELLAPIYYCFSQDRNPDFVDHVEADSFYCFLKLMTTFKDNFIKSLDKSPKGIYTRLQLFGRKLKKIDPLIQEHFAKYDVIPQFYCMRWIMLGFTQEFVLSNVLRLWDTILSHPHIQPYIEYLSLSVIQTLRVELL